MCELPKLREDQAVYEVKPEELHEFDYNRLDAYIALATEKEPRLARALESGKECLVQTKVFQNFSQLPLSDEVSQKVLEVDARQLEALSLGGPEEGEPGAEAADRAFLQVVHAQQLEQVLAPARRALGSVDSEGDKENAEEV